MSVLTNSKLYVGSYDLSGYALQVAGAPNVVMVDNGVMNAAGISTTEPGLESHKLSAKVFMAADRTSAATYKSHDVIRTYWKVTDTPVTWVPVGGGASGDVCGMMRSTLCECTPAGQINNLYTADISAQNSTGPAVWGTILESGTKVAGGNSTARQLGAVAAGQTLYAVLHVFSCTGTLTLTIQSDDAVGFASPTGILAFTAATDRTSQFMTLANANTDTYWRATWTLPSGSASFVVAMGIL